MYIHILCFYTGTRYKNTTQYYYGDFRARNRNPWPEHILCDSLESMNEVDQDDRVSVRAKLASASGFTGLSILHRFHHLYKFDILKDLVFDAMHNVLLNVVRNHIRHSQEKGYLNPLVERRLLAVPWTAG